MSSALHTSFKTITVEYPQKDFELQTPINLLFHPLSKHTTATTKLHHDYNGQYHFNMDVIDVSHRTHFIDAFNYMHHSYFFTLQRPSVNSAPDEKLVSRLARVCHRDESFFLSYIEATLECQGGFCLAKPCFEAFSVLS